MIDNKCTHACVYLCVCGRAGLNVARWCESSTNPTMSSDKNQVKQVREARNKSVVKNKIKREIKREIKRQTRNQSRNTSAELIEQAKRQKRKQVRHTNAKMCFPQISTAKFASVYKDVWLHLAGTRMKGPTKRNQAKIETAPASRTLSLGGVPLRFTQTHDNAKPIKLPHLQEKKSRATSLLDKVARRANE